MGNEVNNNGLTPRVTQHLQDVASDKKVSKEEYGSLTAEEKEALKTGLAGNYSNSLEKFEKWDKELAQQVEAKQKEDRPWYKKAYDFVSKNISGVSMMAGGLALEGVGLAAYIGTAVAGVVASSIALPVMLAGVALFMIGASSCTSQNDEPPVQLTVNDNSSAETNVSINVTMADLGNVSNSSSIKDLINAFNNYVAKQEDYQNRTEEYLKAILQCLMSSGISLDKILAMLEGVGADVKVLVELAKENNKQNAENTKVLNAILKQLTNLNGMGDDIKALLFAIMGKIDNNNDMTAEQSKTLLAILEKLEMLNETMKQLDDNQQQDLTAILNAVIEGNQISAATLNVVNAILDKLGEIQGRQDVDLSAILDAIANIATGNGGNVDLSTIENLLAQLLESSATTNSILTDINDKLDAVSVALQGIKLTIDANHTAVIAKLDAILAKIPNGCHCDVTVIIAKLDELIAALKEDPDDANKHEGILDDLDQYFN